MPILASLVGSKVALAALAVVALGGGGAAVAVAAHDLPTPAHAIAAVTPSASPADDAEVSPDPTPTETGRPGTTTGPDVTGSAAFGLCTAYLAGGVPANSTPGASLTALAGEDGVDAYCNLIVESGPGQSQSQSEHGKPADAAATKPEMPEQSTQGTDHRPAGQHGR